MDESRLRTLLAEELEKASSLPDNAPEHLACIRTGPLTPGISAAIQAMRVQSWKTGRGPGSNAPATP